MIVFFFIVFVVSLVLGRKKIPKFRKMTDAIFLKIPIFGTLLKKAAVARFCRTLATTFAAGMPLIHALRIASKATGNVVYEDAILDIREDITAGQQLNFAMNASKIFPNMVVQMAAIGEESAELDAMMNKAACIYEEDVDTAVDSLSSLLEPIIMTVLGVLVGGLVIAMYLPIFKMGQVF